MSVSASLPNLGAVADAATNASTGLNQFLQTAGALASGGPGSPLNAITQALGGLQGVLTIDLSGLSQGLPQAITTIGHALPDDALRFVEDLQSAYGALRGFLDNSPLVQQIGQGQSLQQAALAVLDSVLQAFQGRLAALGAGLIDADLLQRVTQALALLQQLAQGQVPEAGALVATLAQQLVGVPHTLLDAARGQLDGALTLLQPLSDVALQAAIGAARSVLEQAYAALAAAVRSFDAADDAAYAVLQGLIDAWQQAQGLAFDAVQAACTALTAVVAAPGWDPLFQVLAAALAAVPLQDVPTLGDAIDAMAGLLEDLVRRLSMVLSPEDLAAQVSRMSAALNEQLSRSGLAQVQQLLIDFIGRIEAEVQKIPTEQVQQAVQGMLARVRQELDALGISQVNQRITQGFEAAQRFVDQRIGNDLAQAVSGVLGSALQQFNRIPVAELGQALADVIAQAGALIQQLAGELEGALAQLRDLLSQLDGLDFKPLADEVVTEIDALTAKLAAIKPESLGEGEKLALQGGMALLRAIDLKGLVNDQLKQGYATVDAQLTQAVQAVLDAWLALRGRIVGFDGAQLMAPVDALLGQVTEAVQSINGATVTAPLDALVDQALAQARQLSPGALLDPLRAPYQQMMATINRANPAVWVQPLRTLNAEIDRLVTLIDITPLLDLLEAKERELFAQARDGLLQALDALQLPPPLDAFLDTMKALVMGLADAVFGNPDQALPQFNLLLNQSVRPSSLFQPLDVAWDQLLAALAAQPPQDVLAALEAVRAGLGAALPALNPAQVMRGLRQAQAGLAVLSPGALAGVATLPGLRAQLDVRLSLADGHEADKLALRSRFDVALAPIRLELPDSRLNQLQRQHQALADALRQRVNGLDASGAQAAWQQLDAGLSRLLPAFLRQPQPLQMADVTAGLAAMRPSTQAQRIDAAAQRFLADLAPMQSAIDGSVNGFFQALRSQALALHPAALKDAVAGVYATLRTKLQVLNPDVLAADLDAAVWQPLMAPLRAIDPAALALPLNALYQRLVDTLGTAVHGLVAQIRSAVDAFLRQVRAALAQVLDALKAQLQAILAAVTGLITQLDQLIVHDLLERLLALLDNLETSFNRELDRVGNEFDEMLGAIPLGGSGGGGQLAVAA